VQNSFSYCRNNPIKYQDLTGAIEKSVDEIIEYSGCFEDDFNVLLIVHVPDVENIEEGYIGHIEVALKYFDKWRIYSYGPASHSGITANSGSADACLKVREGNDKWETKKYKYSSYGIAFYRPSLLIRHAIQVMSEDLGKTGEFKTPATGKYDMKNSNYDQYSLVSGLGCVCRDYANRILTALSIDVLNEYNSADEYFPKGFYNAYRNR
ncbi:MAG: hypothetical protein Q4A54_12290, partial [Parabacteroides sp.]|nr:hypothetical protein [Parabacteroides sp.]